MAKKSLHSTSPGVQRAYGYVRVSTDAQADSGLSIDEQQTKIRARCVENNWTLEHVHIDAGVSGGTPLGDRPEGKKLLAAVQPGDVVVCAKMDRAFRSARDALEVIESFRARRISLWLLDLGNDCSGNGISELIVTILAAVSQFERGLTSERIKDAKRASRRDSRFLGGQRQFGYDVGEGKKLIPNEREQQAIGEILALRKEGKTLMAVRDAMRAKGIAISHTLIADLERRYEAEAALKQPALRGGPAAGGQDATAAGLE
jgi:putative DNA-invertase from lambdoid prophage Rac